MAAIRRPLYNPFLTGGRSPLLRSVRQIHISATPSTTSINGLVDLSSQTQAIPKLSGFGPFPAEITFEVLGAPYSLLSVALPASSNLYTRRGTLLGLNGRPSDTTSTLSILSPLLRAPKRIPFLYQKLTSTSPLTCIISTNTPNTTFCVLSLDGTADWTLSQPDALLAWSGHSIVVRPSEVTGRGLVALAGRGQVYQLSLKPGEEFIIHRKSLLAYSAAGQKPTKSRLATTTLRFQIPRVVGLRLTEKLKDVQWINAVRTSKPWELLWKAVWAIKTSLWGDREFLRFVGPATILLQSRTGGRIKDLIRREEIGELADIEPHAYSASASSKGIETVMVRKGGLETAKQAEKMVEDVVAKDARETKAAPTLTVKRTNSGSLKRVIVTKDGKVEFEDSDFKEFQR
ncbi:hypothetical protein K440DRAFT_619467 [Wilcoxina mikolae CBS 423.85]|nr:hypothetical protein K440DRAFT_619467 [Wilcoxina mikolae CBS 423.85]